MSNRTKSITTSKLAQGESFTGSLVDVKQGKFGPVYVFSIDGQDVDVFPSGNLKFLAEKIEKGQLSLNSPLTITRTADIKTKAGFTSSQFSISDATQTEAKAAPSLTAATSVADKLAAIRAKRGTNSTNS